MDGGDDTVRGAAFQGANAPGKDVVSHKRCLGVG
jgi:hypothetical protein